jgi:hypothetical protein
MKHITFYLDFISPYAHLAFEQIPSTLQGLSYTIDYKPVFLGALLRHHGQLGPAEIAAKRDWTYRHVQWLGHAQGVELTMPRLHPFNPLPLLRLSIACAQAGDPNRFVCESIFRHVWHGGLDPNDVTRLAALQTQLAPAMASDDEAVKARLRQNGDEAIAAHVFGVPAMVVDNKVFWGFDALPMLRQYLDGDAWFEGPGWHNVDAVQSGIPLKR